MILTFFEGVILLSCHPNEEYLVYYNDSHIHERITNSSLVSQNQLQVLNIDGNFLKTIRYLDLQLMSLYLHSNHFYNGFRLFRQFIFYLKLNLKLLYRFVSSVLVFLMLDITVCVATFNRSSLLEGAFPP